MPPYDKILKVKWIIMVTWQADNKWINFTYLDILRHNVIVDNFYSGERWRIRPKTGKTDRQTDKQIERQTHSQTDSETDRQIHRQTDRQTDRERDGQTVKQSDRQTDRRTW